MKGAFLLGRWIRLSLGAVILLLFLLQQNFTLQTEETSLFSEKLPEGFSGLRILQISDLHGRSFGRDHSLLLRKAEEAKADLILLTGDLFENDTPFSSMEPLIRGLCDIAAVYYVTGNHEWQRADLRSCLEQLERWGAVVLQNEYRLLEKEGASIVIAGVDDPCGPYDRKTPQELMAEIRKEQGEACFVLVLDHRNDHLSLWAELGADLVLSGHCHGGVLRLPFVGGLIGPGRKLFPEYDAGLYAQNGTQLYVSRGLGFPLRLLNRPHLPILVLNRK